MASKEPEPEPAADEKDAFDALEAEAKEFEKVASNSTIPPRGYN